MFPLEGFGDLDRERTVLTLMAGRVSRMVRSRLDIDFNLHLLRSLLATLYAEANPGDIQTAQIKLGHKNARTTQRFYIDADQRNAHRRFDAVIDDLIELRTKTNDTEVGRTVMTGSQAAMPTAPARRRRLAEGIAGGVADGSGTGWGSVWFAGPGKHVAILNPVADREIVQQAAVNAASRSGLRN